MINPYCTHKMVRMRTSPGASVCTDEECSLSGGYAHIGPCEKCRCKMEHAIDECPNNHPENRYTIKDMMSYGISESTIADAQELLLVIQGYAEASVEGGHTCIVYPFYEAPLAIRKACCLNGGDEDWMAILWREPEIMPRWIEKMDSCEDPDVYIFGNAIVYIGSHA